MLTHNYIDDAREIQDWESVLQDTLDKMGDKTPAEQTKSVMQLWQEKNDIGEHIRCSFAQQYAKDHPDPTNPANAADAIPSDDAPSYEDFYTTMYDYLDNRYKNIQNKMKQQKQAANDKGQEPVQKQEEAKAANAEAEHKDAEITDAEIIEADQKDADHQDAVNTEAQQAQKDQKGLEIHVPRKKPAEKKKEEKSVVIQVPNPPKQPKEESDAEEADKEASVQEKKKEENEWGSGFLSRIKKALAFDEKKKEEVTDKMDDICLPNGRSAKGEPKSKAQEIQHLRMTSLAFESLCSILEKNFPEDTMAQIKSGELDIFDCVKLDDEPLNSEKYKNYSPEQKAMLVMDRIADGAPVKKSVPDPDTNEMKTEIVPKEHCQDLEGPKTYIEQYQELKYWKESLKPKESPEHAEVKYTSKDDFSVNTSSKLKLDSQKPDPAKQDKAAQDKAEQKQKKTKEAEDSGIYHRKKKESGKLYEISKMIDDKPEVKEPKKKAMGKK